MEANISVPFLTLSFGRLNISATVCPLRSPRWPVVFGEFGHYGDGCLGKEGDLEGQERIHLRHTIAMP